MENHGKPHVLETAKSASNSTVLASEKPQELTPEIPSPEVTLVAAGGDSFGIGMILLG